MKDVAKCIIVIKLFNLVEQNPKSTRKTFSADDSVKANTNKTFMLKFENFEAAKFCWTIG